MKPELNSLLKLPALEAAPLLLGWILVRRTPDRTIKLKIVETEAYHQDDPASHSFRGPTRRTAPMFKAGGHIYIYFTYGMHYCLNIVTGQAGRGEAVLLRAAEPLEGIEAMLINHPVTDIKKLANGPAKLTRALGIKSTAISGEKLNKSSIWMEPPVKTVKIEDIITSPRIGIREAAEMPWRFYIKDNPFVSRAG